MEKIHRTLTREVADIYIRHVPAFRGLGRERVYDMVMSNHALALECYKLFESRPDLFANLLVDREGKAVSEANRKLSCGRSLEDITALLVRAVARRHFLRRFGVTVTPVRKRLAPPPAPPAPRFFLPFRRPEPVQEPPKIRRKATRGDSLYRALRHHLRYAWQLKLIPHYTPLPVSLVRELGPKILDYRSVADLKALLKEGPAKDAPALIDVKLPEGRQGHSAANAKADAMWAVAEGLGLAGVFEVDQAEMRRIIGRAAIASGGVITAMAGSGLSMRAMVVMLCAFERHLGQARMPGLFGPGAPGKFIETLKVQIGIAGLTGLDNPGDIRDRVDVMIRRMQRERAIS